MGQSPLRSHSLFSSLYETNVELSVFVQVFKRLKHWGTLMVLLPLTSNKERVERIAQVMQITCYLRVDCKRADGLWGLNGQPLSNTLLRGQDKKGGVLFGCELCVHVYVRIQECKCTHTPCLVWVSASLSFSFSNCKMC